MAYFSNGTEGDFFQENNCEMCSHWNKETDCHVWDAHLIFAYDSATAVQTPKVSGPTKEIRTEVSL